MPARFLGLTIQTDVRCASGAAVAHFPPEDLAACSAVLSPTEPESLTFTIPRDDARAAEVYVGRVVRTTFAGGTDDREWDITAVDDSNAESRLTVTAQPIALRLARVLYVGANSITGAPEPAFDDASAEIADIIDARVIAACDAAGLTWIERGTIDSTALVDLSGEWASALEIVQALAGAGRANGEWQLRRNGDTDYRLDILDAVGSSAATVPIRTRVNLLENRRKRETLDLATRVYPRGSADSLVRTMADHLWRVKTVVDAEWLELEDILGGDGPLLYDDQLNGLYLAVLNSHTFSSQAIADSVAATQRVQVASTAGISVGEWCRVFTGSGAAGARVTSLKNPSAAAALTAGGYGDRARVIDRAAIRGDCNLVPNPWMRDYASATAAPDDWTESVGTPANRTIARESTIVRDTAPYSCRFTTTGTTTLALETPDIRPWATADRRHFCGLWFNVQAVPADLASAVIFELITSGGTLIQELGRWVRGSDPEIDTWIRFAPEVVDLSGITTAVRLRARICRTNSANADSGWDICFGPAMLAESEIAVADIEYSGGTKLWQEANRTLPQVSQIVRGYDLRVLDLARDDQATFSSLELVPGGTVEVTDTDLAETVSLRLVEYRPDYLNPLASQLRVGAVARDITADIGQTGSTSAAPSSAADPLVYTLCEARQTDADATTVDVTVTASAETGTPAVRLVAIEGTGSLSAGAAIGQLVASGSVWTFTRGAFGSGPTQVVFEAVLNDAVTDADLIVIPEQGRDTVPLQCRARVIATRATEIDVRVAVADPFPQGADSGSIAYSEDGLGSISPSSPQTVTPASTITEGAGTYRDFTIPRPAVGQPPGRATFTATATDRTSDSDAIDVPAQSDLSLAIGVTFNSDGSAVVTISGSPPVASIKYAVSTSAMPNLATVQGESATDGRTLTATLTGPYALGETLYVAALAYGETSGGGEEFGLFLAQVARGNATATKIVRLPFAALVPFVLPTSGDSTYNDGYLRTRIAHTAYLALPKGATLQKVRAYLRGHTTGAGDKGYWNIYLRRVEDGASSTELDTAATSLNNTTWETIELSGLAEDTSGARTYYLRLTPTLDIPIFPDPVPTQPDVSWIEYEYDVPDLLTSI